MGALPSHTHRHSRASALGSPAARRRTAGLVAGLAALLLLAPPAAAQLRFSGPTAYELGGIPRDMVVADFNGDSDPDLATDDIRVLLGGPAGSFSAPTLYEMGTTMGVATGDFNADSDPDLAVAEAHTGEVKVVLGGPGGSFGAPTSYDIGARADSVAIGDFDGDGDPDIAASNPHEGNVAVLLGGPGGSFGPPTQVATGGDPREIAVGDFNGDSDPDLAVGRPVAGDVAVLLGSLGGTFVADLNHPVPDSPNEIAVDDFDADSDLDLAVGSGDSRGVAVLLGGPGGGFGSPTYFDTAGHAGLVSVGDFNGDADPDLAVSTNHDAVSVLLGGTGGSFAQATSFEAFNTGYWTMGVGDFNGDSDLDIVGANGVVEVALNALHGPSPPTITDVDPDDPANDNSPTVKGTAPPDTTVRIYGHGSCAGPLRATGSAAEFAAGLTVTVPDNSHATFFATATNADGVESVCSSPVTYVEDSLPPAPPGFYSIDDESPRNDNSPEFRGDAEPSSTVALYKNADCLGTPAATGSAADFDSPGLTVSVPDDSFTRFYATATDRAGNVSGCSSEIGSHVSYTEDSTGPAAPQITGTTPSSPADDERPEVRGVVGAGDPTTVKLYANATCSGAPAATGTVSDFTGGGITVAVAPDAATELSARVADPVGNDSDCSNAFTYVEDSGPPSAAHTVSPHPAYIGETVTFDASASSDAPHGTITRYEWDLDGNGSFETDTGGNPVASRSFSAVADITPAVRVTSSRGGRIDTAVAQLSIRKRPPAGRVGISINAGARYTNDPDVTLAPVWPAFAVELVVSNDGGFAQAGTFPVDAAIPWTLDSSGAERLPRTVYVRFDGSTQTFTDDIVLDQTPPSISSARLAGQVSAAVTRSSGKRRFTLRVRARDNLSGVRWIQVALRKREPGTLRKFESRLAVRTRLAPRYVRVRDRAGNFSRWRRVTVR